MNGYAPNNHTYHQSMQGMNNNGAPPPPPPPSGPPPNQQRQWNGAPQQQQQQQQQVMNSYNMGMSDPAAAYQAMQQQSFHPMMGSNMNMQMNMANMNMGSSMNIGSPNAHAMMMNPQQSMSPHAQHQHQQSQHQHQHYKQTPTYGPVQPPTQEFMHMYGPMGGFYQPMGQPVYYDNQPQGGGDAIVPPPPMVLAANGEMVPSNDNPANPAVGRKRKSKKKKKNKSSKSSESLVERSGRSKDKKSSKSRSSSKKKKKKHKKKKDESPPPPPPPSSGTNTLNIPGNNSSEMAAPQSGGQHSHPAPHHHPGTSDDDDNSSNAESSNSDDSKEVGAPFGDDPGDIPDASTVFKGKVSSSTTKKKSRHQKFESKNQFIRRRPVSGVPLSVQQQLHGIADDKMSSHLRLISSKRCEKTKDTVSFLRECLLKEVLFQGMDDSMIHEIVDVMYRVDCPKAECIIRQNEYGDAYFVIQSGAFDIMHQEHDAGKTKIVGEMLPGKAFGEGSLLYSIPRAATLKATKACVVWALDATKFLEIRQKISQQVNDKTSKIVRFLKKVELFKKYHHQDLVSIGQSVEERKYSKNARIVNQGDDADEFFLIKTGAAIAVIKGNDGKEQTVKKYTDCDYFGERGIYKNDKRAASIVATSTTRVYVIKAADFRKLMADPLSKMFEEQMKKYDEIAFDNGIKQAFVNLIECKLEDFKILGVLGVGSFGRVSLVRDPSSNITYSLKKVRKNKVIETGQQEHVRNERAVLATLDSAFCCRLFGTYQDTLNIYFLMEPVLGGELFTVLRWNKRFSEKTARFYAACVVLAFEHLHFKNIIYRDLKPENLLISANGYCKLVDFGFAKKRNNSCTLCGTPEYLSPEVIQNVSQGFAVDWWTLGIFVYEMLIGHPPFQNDAQTKMYEKILVHEVDFPLQPALTPRVGHLISGLLEKDAFRRLGAGTNGTEQILNHPWFQGLDWKEMRNQEIAAPYVPNINGQDDLSHYDVYPEENIVEELDADPAVYEWCEDF